VLVNIGVDESQPNSEKRYIILVNVFAFFLISLAWFYVPLVYISLPDHTALIVTLICHGIAFIPVLILNYFRKYLLSRLLLGVAASVFLTLESLLTGPEAYTHFFFISSIVVPFFIYPPKERVYQLFIVCFIMICFLSLNYWYINHEPIRSITDPAVLRFVQWSVKTGTLFSVVCISIYAQYIILKTENMLKAEHEKAEILLRNILPDKIANRLKDSSRIIADGFDFVSILFADIVGFTEMSSKVAPEKLVGILNGIFTRFDDLIDTYRLEKIKTIGDAYMVASGIPEPREKHAELIFKFAIEMINEIRSYNENHETDLQIRIGINSGSVVAGVIGKKKFIYDLWGDSVNIASRMESYGVPGCIHITESTYQFLKDEYVFEDRGEMEIRGKGKMRTYLYRGGKNS
jgi:class 3 adenylate cyclase